MRPRPGKSALVISEPRTGSNLLLSYLACHPDVAVTEEVLNPWSPIGFPKARILNPFALGHVRRSLVMNSRVAVCKLMLHHLRYHRISFDKLAEALPDAFVIVLYRRNLLEQYVSMRRLQATGVHKTIGGRKGSPAPQIVVEIARFQEWARTQQTRFSELMGSPLVDGECAVLSYEELVAGPEVAVGNIFRDLGVHEAAIWSDMGKQGTDGLAGAVINYDEVAPLVGEESATLQPEVPERRSA